MVFDAGERRPGNASLSNGDQMAPDEGASVVLAELVYFHLYPY